jgi:hypothetical protein
VLLDDLVEGPLHVEHHRVEPATGRRVGVLHRARDVVQLVQAHRLREPARRVDREHDHPAAALGRPESDRRRRRGLADAPGAAADDHPGAGVVEQRVDVEDRRLPGGTALGAHATACSTRMSARS